MSTSEFMGVILAAGKGTRMRPFSTHWPKPLLPVLGKPLMVHQIEIMRDLGVRDVVLVIGHLGHEVVQKLGDGSRFGMRFRYVEQEDTLGIAHAVSRLDPHVDRPFFLFLGDIFFETENLGSMAERFGVDGTAAVLAVRQESDPAALRRNFTVEVGGDGRHVVRVVEKPRFPKTDLKGCGIYLFDPAFFDAVRRTPRTALRDEYEITDAIQLFIDGGHRVEAAAVIRQDLNVSYARDLLKLNVHLLDKSGEPNWLGAGVQIHPGAKLERCVVMEGAAVTAPITLRECLVFPNTQVRRALDATRLIFTPEHEIHCDEHD
ncbi:MAG: NTP transferase domain-containing protein [Phycisphaerales bacterium]|nr:NTP transferase domain-containing protein [Phycisphaerales bacterium]